MEIAGVILATYIITAALIYSDGPYGVLYKLRNLEKVKDFGVLECFICLSFWVALIVSSVASQPLWMLFIAWGVSSIVDAVIVALRTK